MNKNHHKFIPEDEHIDEMFSEYNMNGTTTPIGISVKLWYAIWCDKISKSMVRDLIVIYYKIGIYSEMDTIATTTAMPKKVNADMAKKFRPITLQSEIPKMCCKISLNQTKQLLFNHIDQAQGGAQPYLSHYEQISTFFIVIKQQLAIGNSVFCST